MNSWNPSSCKVLEWHRSPMSSRTGI